MKLQEFFITQKDTKLNDIDKLDLYQSFLYKKTQRTGFKRTSFVHAKTFVYSTFVAIMILGMYGVYFFKDNIQDNKLFSIISNSTTNTAQADYIAQVIDFDGNFSIEHQGKLTKTNNIGNGDTIILKAGSQMVFQISSGTQSKIIGPAKLVIQKTEAEKYKLNLIYGDFIQMKGNEKHQQTIELAINDLTVKQQDTSKPLNLEFIKQDGNQILKNNGADILVTKTNGKDHTTKISKKQIVAIQNNDITVFDNFDKFSKAVQDKNISQTFALSKNTEISISGTQNDIDTSLLALLTSPTVSNNQDQIDPVISQLTEEEEKILTPTQNESIRGTLHGDFLMADLKETYVGFVAGNSKDFAYGYSKIEKRIEQLYKNFGLTYTSPEGEANQKLQTLKTKINQLVETMEDYAIPPKYIHNIKSLNNRTKKIIAQGYASKASTEEATSVRDILQKSLGGDLLFQ